jgi:phage tail-like protein
MSQKFEFRLIIQGPEGSWSYTVPVRPEPIIIGRQQGNDIVLDQSQVSRRHAAIRCTDTKCEIVDLKSANGTHLNGKKLAPEVPSDLHQGDSVEIGSFKMDFQQIPLEEPILPPVAVEELPAEKAPEQIDEPEPPSPPLPPSLPAARELPRPDPSQPPPGLTFQSERLLGYLPGIYHTEFMANFLGIFEAVMFPSEWLIDGFDLFLDPGTAPRDFLPWLANWFNLVFDSTWSESQIRTFLKEAHPIYSRLGTRWALSRILEIYCGQMPEIDDQAEDLPPHTFRLKLPRTASQEQKHIERLINTFKPTHTAYILELVG